MIHFRMDTVPGNCGVGFFYDFSRDKPQWGASATVDASLDDAGCGWYVVGFVNTPICKQAYEELCAEYLIVYQSPVRINANSGREFFFCVFDTGEVEQSKDEGEVDFEEEDDEF